MTLQVPPTRFLPVHAAQPVEWLVEQAEVPYPEAIAFMDDRVARIHDGSAAELVWLLEHPPLYTAGTSARAEDLVEPERFPVFEAGRGGEYTYHGPGQRVVYVMLDLKRRRQDVRAFVRALEAWIIASLAEFGVQAETRTGRVGVWVRRGPPHPAGAEDKIAAIGIRLRRWVSFHGIAINVAPDLSHFNGIVPCGILEHGVTSLQDLGVGAGMAALDEALHRHFTGIFGAVSQGTALPSEAAGA